MYKEFFLKVSEKHLIYVRVQGNEKGVPVLLFHGGPGDSSGDSCLDYFDREKFLLIQFDQRGAGKSKVLGEDILFDNNSEALAADAKEILRFLGVDRVVFYGASWGSTLALYTACKYPELCRGFLLRAVFLADEEQMSWTYERGGAEKIYPDAFSEFKQFLDEYRLGGERNLQVMLRLMEEGDDECRKKLCRVINDYELKLLAPIDLLEYWEEQDVAEEDGDPEENFEDEDAGVEFDSESLSLSSGDFTFEEKVLDSDEESEEEDFDESDSPEESFYYHNENVEDDNLDYVVMMPNENEDGEKANRADLNRAPSLPIFSASSKELGTIGVAKIEELDFEKATSKQVRIAMHYARNRYFIEGDSILDMIESLPEKERDIFKSLPCEIVHGRMDVLCPLYAAYELKKVLDGANLTIIPYASHYALPDVEGDVMREKSDDLYERIKG